jgi:hypothetical protein
LQQKSGDQVRAEWKHGGPEGVHWVRVKSGCVIVDASWRDQEGRDHCLNIANERPSGYLGKISNVNLKSLYLLSIIHFMKAFADGPVCVKRELDQQLPCFCVFLHVSATPARVGPVFLQLKTFEHLKQP